MGSKQVLPELEDLATQIGQFIQYWGFKKIHGQIWSHLFLSRKSLDAGELIARLGVSKALISMSISDLLEFDVIIALGKGPDNTFLYKANEDLTSVIFNVLKHREKVMLSKIKSAHELVKLLPLEQKAEMGLDENHLDVMGQLIHSSQLALNAFLSFCPVDSNSWKQFNVDDSDQKPQ